MKHLTFKEVCFKDLVKDTKYLIISIGTCDSYTGIFVRYTSGTFTEYSEENVILFINFYNTTLIKRQLDKPTYNAIRFDYNNLKEYYCVEFQKKKYRMQWNLEQQTLFYVVLQMMIHSFINFI